MSTKSKPATARNASPAALPKGVGTRRRAAERLAEVLAGAAFTPFSKSEIDDGADRAFANKLITAALRRHGHVTAILETLLERGLPKRAGLFEPVLRLGLAELLFVPDADAHAALFTAGEVLKRDRRGARHLKLLNAVLRNAQRRAGAFRSLDKKLLFPPWLRDKWGTAYGPQALDRFADALLETPPLDLSLADDDPAVIAALGGTPTLPGSIRLQTRDRAVADLPFYREGRWWVQDVGATLAARLLKATAGDKALDLCAAPGGKTAQLARGGFAVTALDDDAARMARLETNLTRLGYLIEMRVEDGAAYTAKEGFDAVLVDAPCSASGTFRRHPELVFQRRPDGLASRIAIQRDLVRNAVANLKPCGTLVFCTCSLEPEEGEDQAAWIEKNLDVEPAPVAAKELDGFQEAITEKGFVRTHPGMPVPGPAAGTLDGFFVARFQKRGQSHR